MSELRNPELFAKQAFDVVTTKLSAFNLTDIWSINSLLSVIDNFDNSMGGANSFFPVLNYERITMLSKAIIGSNSREYKEKLFDINLIPLIFNKLSDATLTNEFIEGSKDPNFKLLNFMARKAILTYDMQNIDIKHNIARSYALYEHYPLKLVTELKDKHKSNYIDIPKIFEEKYGLSIKEYLLIGLIIIIRYQNIYKKYFAINKKFSEEIIERRKKDKEVTQLLIRNLASIIVDSDESRQSLFFNPHDLMFKDSSIIDTQKINGFLNLVSKTSKELSILQRIDPYNKGDIVYRLCPLQRYPLIKMNEERYIVPNIGYFISSFTRNIHFILQDLYPANEFNQTFGSVFEYYINDFVEDRLESLTVIPETKYLKSKNHNDGPDLCVIDKENTSIIMFEVKSKNLRLDTKLAPLSKDLLVDLDRSFKALKKLPDKYDDLLHGFSEYSEWQKEIDSICHKDKENVYAFSIINHGILLLPDLINYIRENEEEHFLNYYPFKFGILTVENFEKVIELAHEQKKSLPDLLHSYWESSISKEVKEHSTEQLNGLTVDNNETFLKKMFDILIEYLGKDI